MSKERCDRITEYRQRQPLSELVRKMNKAKGRHSNRFWIQEVIDVAYVRGRELAAKLIVE